jgi:ribonuclease T2
MAVLGPAVAADQSGDFDLYLLSLSWSPEYCATHQSDAAQCGAGKHFGLVVHGLWPQYATPRVDPASGQQSGWPANCPGSANPAPPEAAAIWPSPDLYRHEWQKHGTCTGLQPDAYVALTKALRQRFQMPAILMPQARNQAITAKGLRDSIAAANPGLAPEDLTLVCHRAWLTEIRLCLARDGAHGYLACPATVSNDTPCPETIRIQGLGN